MKLGSGIALAFVVSAALSAGLLALPDSSLAEGGNWPPLGQLASGVPQAVAVQGNYAYVAALTALTVIDVSSPAQPRVVGYCDTPGQAREVVVSDAYVYVADGDAGLRVVDVSDPSQPREVGHWDTPGIARGIAASGVCVYIADADSGLCVVDVSDPHLPVQLGRCATPGWAERVAVAGGYAYVADGGAGLAVISVSDPAHPVLAGVCATSYALDVDVSHDLAYVADGDGVHVISVFQPANPGEIGYWQSLSNAQGVRVSAGHAYVANGDSLRIVNVGSASHPYEVGHCETPGYASDVAVAGGYAYVADNGGGLSVVDVSYTSSPKVVGRCDTRGLALAVDVSGGYAYVAEGAALSVVDVSDPLHAAAVGYWQSPSYCNAVDVAVSGGYAYVAGQGDGLWVVSVSNPAAPVSVGHVYTPGWAERVTVSGGYAYVAGSADTRLRIIDVSLPAYPREVAHYDAPGYVCDVAVTGDRACLTYWDHGSGVGGLRILDVTDPLRPAERGGWDKSLFNESTVAISGETAFLACPEGLVGNAGLWAIDLRDPVNPTQSGFWPSSLASAVRVSGGYAYVASGGYGYDGSLRIVDVSNPADMVEVAYWETPGGGLDLALGNGCVYLADYGWGLMVFAEASPGIAGQVCVRGTTTSIPGATVDAYRGGPLKASGTTAANGVYGITNLPVGTYVLCARKQGYVTQTKARIAVVANQTTHVNFGLDPLCLTGQVCIWGTSTPIPGATVTVYQSGVAQTTSTTDAQGIYQIGRSTLSAGSYVVVTSKAGYVRQTKLAAVTASTVTYLNFFLDPLCLTGQVRQAGTTTNLAGATVAAYLGSATTPSATATTDANGIYQIGGLATGTYTVIASKSGYVKQTKPGIAVTAGVVTYVNFNLQVSGKLRGQVTDKVSSLPIIGATIYARTGGVVWATGTTVVPYGVYEIASDLPAGTYSVLCQKGGYQDFGRIGIVVTAANTSYVNFTLQPQ